MNEELSAYDYPLDNVSIAQSPAAERGSSRLLVLERSSGRRHHRVFRDLPEFLESGDLLVLNETRVFPARLFVRRRTGARAEILLLEPLPDDRIWRALGRPVKSLRVGESLAIEGSDHVFLRPVGREADQVLVEFLTDDRPLPPPEVFAVCAEVGRTPLPPYIERPSAAQEPEDETQYQTVYARNLGAVAAPTAGLHFEEELLGELSRRNVEIARITLHVGLGTFQPLTDDRLCGDSLHSERITVRREAGNAIRRARAEGRRIVAVGTTCVRTLESIDADDTFPLERRTSLFIKPGHVFRNVGAMVTNFHLPRSSPLVMVSAFAGRDLVLDAYQEALRRKYRFFSYGDAMLIV